MNLTGILLILVALAAIVLILLVALRRRPAPPPGVLPTERVNLLAATALVTAFVLSIPAVVMGHIALAQIRRSGERGWALAVTALVLGYLGVVVGAIGLAFLLRQLAPYF